MIPRTPAVNIDKNPANVTSPHPIGNGRVGISNESRANIAESDKRLLERLMSDTCMRGTRNNNSSDEFEKQKPWRIHTRRWRTVTWYRTASPASVSNFESCEFKKYTISYLDRLAVVHNTTQCDTHGRVLYVLCCL